MLFPISDSTKAGNYLIFLFLGEMTTNHADGVSKSHFAPTFIVLKCCLIASNVSLSSSFYIHFFSIANDRQYGNQQTEILYIIPVASSTFSAACQM